MIELDAQEREAMRAEIIRQPACSTRSQIVAMGTAPPSSGSACQRF